MYAVAGGRRGLDRLRGLGDVCSVMANGSRVCGPTPTLTASDGTGRLANRTPRGSVTTQMFVNPSIGNKWYPVSLPTGPNVSLPAAGGYSPGSSGYQFGPQFGGQARPNQNPSQWNSNSSCQGMNAAQLEQLAQTNPAALTPAQLACLQASGTVASTLPYSSAASLATTGSVAGAIDPQCVAAGMTGGPYPNCTALAAAAAPATSFDLTALYGGLPLYAWLAGGGLALFLVMKKR